MTFIISQLGEDTMLNGQVLLQGKEWKVENVQGCAVGLTYSFGSVLAIA